METGKNPKSKKRTDYGEILVKKRRFFKKGIDKGRVI
jgi:hypothetical protein